jgi:two-component system, NtrC family, sensor kinase
MTITSKKGSQSVKAKPRHAAVKSPLGKSAQTVAELRQELEARDRKLEAHDREITQALDQQAATGEILAVISGSPTDVQPVFDTIAESSMRLCGALFSSVYQFDGELIHMVATRNYPLAALELSQRLFPAPPSRQTFTGRAVLERAVINVPDVQNDYDWFNDADRAGVSRSAGFRSVLSVPILRGGTPIGAITVWHAQVGPFTDRHVTLLKIFAGQAVIAIENVRLFKELQERNADLTQALEQQTGTSEILGIIASSPTDIQPVLDAVAATAARLIDARDVLIDRVDGDVLEHVALYGPMPLAERQRLLTRGTPAGRAVIDRQTIHIHDVVPLLETEYPEAKACQQVTSTRTVLVTPLFRGGIPIGTIQIRRPEVRPFSDKQIALLKTFADQAVIAIENVRLFKELGERNAELREALEHQTATSEVLGIISRSPTDVQPGSHGHRRECGPGFVGSMT